MLMHTAHSMGRVHANDKCLRSDSSISFIIGVVSPYMYFNPNRPSMKLVPAPIPATLISVVGVLVCAAMCPQVAAAGTTAGIPAFAPLTCNADLENANCSDTTLSQLTQQAGNDSVIIPCGTCATYDITNGTTLTVPGGINVEGHLFVPESAHGILNTTSVIVQGRLTIREPAGSDKSFVVYLYGTEDVLFLPHASNEFECGQNATTSEAIPCDLGKKPIAVLGGTLDVDALSTSAASSKTQCPSWVQLRNKSSSSPAVADNLIPDAPRVQGIASANQRHASQTSKVTDVGNGEYNITGATKNMGLRIRLEPKGHLDRQNAIGKTLTLSWEYKVDNYGAHPEWKGKALMRWARYSRPKGTMWVANGSTCSATVPSQDNGWAKCEATFTYTSGIAKWHWNDINLVFTGPDWSSRSSSSYEFHFKNIKIENLDGIVASPDTLDVGTDAASCWNTGDDILITSSSNNPNGYILRRVIAVNENKGLITLDEGVNPLQNSLLSEADGQDGIDFAVEVASLSRRVKFTAEKDDPNLLHGGHLIIFHTPDVAQTLRGVEIDGFGQQGNLGRYPIHIHLSENVEGTNIAKNVIRSSHQRCIVVHGSHNSTLYDNVAFDAIGHCFMLENGGEWHNTFERNLGCKNARHRVTASWTRSDVAEPALFLIGSPKNKYIGNVAAGSAAHGFWFELLPRVGGDAAKLAVNNGFVPRAASLLDGGFVDNVAHSCSQDGVTSQGNAYQFQTRWVSNGDVKNVFENTKSYKNAKDGIMVNARHVHIKGGIIADNDRCINFPLKTMSGAGNVVENLRCIAVSSHQKAAGKVCHGQFEKSNPEPGFAGITFHTNKADGNAETLRNISFEGFDNLGSCWGGKGTAIQVLSPNVLDNKRWTGPAWFDEGLTFDGPAFDIKCGMLDWSKIDSNHKKALQNVYVNDNTGSVGGGAPGAFFARADRDPDATAFVDQSKCTNITLPGSCGMYCEGPCMRRIGIQNNPTDPDIVMVISDGTGKSYSYERNPNAIYYPRWKPDYEAILPKGQYEVTFQNKVTGHSAWPSYAKMTYGGEPHCSDYISTSDVSLVMPNSIDEGLCSDMSFNGDFQTGTRAGWSFSWFGSDIIQETNSTNYYMRTKKRKLTRSNVYTYLDMSCMRQNEQYRVSAKIRIQSEDGVEKSCGSGNCPYLSLRFTKGEDALSPISSISLGQPASIAGDGTWANFETVFNLTDAIPSDAYRALVMVRLQPRIYSSLLLDDFKFEHLP